MLNFFKIFLCHLINIKETFLEIKNIFIFIEKKN